MKAKRYHVLIKIGLPGSIKSCKIIWFSGSFSGNLKDEGSILRWFQCFLMGDDYIAFSKMWKSSKLCRFIKGATAPKTLTRVKSEEACF